MARWRTEWIEASLFAVRNRTGATAAEVVMEPHGPLIVGVIAGNRPWRGEYRSIPDNDSISEVFTRTGEAGTPTLQITWRGPDGETLTEEIVVPV
jgi:hypothetical protein